ncbi:hypothetical protein IE077_000745 [Cardiosporidium cionae]|uniref:DNA repair protein RAD51 homolog 3 n=1 Tax=Cardiosporidium cionae TaxID=476202 RepID=A0ABQ7J6N7_9APIC|nr:hypothetical protein IE077_000745 [Cardiosporidium cionae]|eukprot:KAF8819630.1 hypothetical protein IE077_000745 [Cardiosporidium cionae]
MAKRAKSGKVVKNNPLGRSALQIVEEQVRKTSLQTAIAPLDKLLRGGIPVASGFTEICGPPGAGKTQLCIQLAVNSQFPCFGGCFPKATIIIDTEGGFTTERFMEIARATRAKLHSTSAEADHSGDLYSTEGGDYLNGIRLLRIFDHIELYKVLMQLPQLLEEPTDADTDTYSLAKENRSVVLRQPNYAGLIIIDSISFLFRHQFFSEWAKRAAYLQQLGTQLNRLASDFASAIVVTNHITTKLNDDSGFLRYPSFVPALGNTWMNLPKIRLFIEPHKSNRFENSVDSERVIKLIKSSFNLEGTVRCCIRKEGICELQE